MRNGYLAQSDWPLLTAAAGRIHATHLYIDDSSSVTALDIRARARRLKAEKKQLDLIIVDYLQLMRSPERTENRVLEIADITRGLKALAKELDVPVIAISQLARKTEDRVDKRPQLSDLRDSGAIEQDADVVMFVYREEFYNPKKAEAQGVADIIVGKQRNGPTGDIRLAFLKEITRFENLEEGRG
jgi:replicative DNA helicase